MGANSNEDDYAELRLLRLANAELAANKARQAARIEHLTATNVRLVEQYDTQRTRANVAIKMAMDAEAERLRVEAERVEAVDHVERLVARVQELEATVLVAEVDAIVASDADSTVDEHFDRAVNVLGIDPAQVDRDRKPRLRVVPRQGGAL